MLRLSDYNKGLIYTEVKGCIDCNKCIHECPILKSNVSVMGTDGNYKMCVDEKECILCGTCLDTCIHDVRQYKDDCDAFIGDLEQGKEFSVLVAPSFYLNYPQTYKNVLGYLKSLGVKAFYPVGFGADITAWAYINYIKKKAAGILAQPCPSIVRHIEMHLPELLPNLIPVQSPMMCTAIYLKKYKNIKEDLVFLSPCIAKKIEIESKRGQGLIRHNVTFFKLMEHIVKKGVNLYDYPAANEELDYGMGVLFPRPGGLRENIEYYLGADACVIQIEGEHKAYKFLKSFTAHIDEKHELIPVLVDVLNCEMGCGYGTGTEIRRSDDYTAAFHATSMRRVQHNVMRDCGQKVLLDPAERFARLNESFKDLRLEDFYCEYEPNTADVYIVPDEKVDAVFTDKLMKLTDNDQHVNCSACGYKTCRQMAEAIAYGINRHENCVYYVKNALTSGKEFQEYVQQRLEAMLNTSPLLCAIYDENLKVIEANQAAASLFGLSDKQSYIDRFFELCPEYQPDGALTKEKFVEVLTKAFKEGRINFEWMHQMPDSGNLIPCEVHLERVNLGGRNVVIAYVRDMREQKEMLARLEAAFVAEESSKAKSMFLARMSHEIRTPISAVLGVSEIQLQNAALSPVVEESFAKIHDSASMLLSIVNDLLDLSKIEAGKLSLFPEEYEVASLISDVIHPHVMYMGEKDIEFRVNVDDRLPKILVGDTLRVKQIINNLLSNAFKYTESGHVEFSMLCREPEPDTDYVVLEIKITDTGLGMTEEQVNILHNDYTRFHEKESRYVSGTGLGMPITFNLVEIMDAAINVQSEVGKGTMVLVCIPQKSVSDEVLGKELTESLRNFELSAQSAEKKFKFVPEPMPYGRVLVVDDVDANLYVARGLLAFYDINVETCSSGYEAIDKIKKGNFYDIIFMDQMMPGMNGTETMRALREMDYNLPIVALTANALIGQAEEFIKNGFDGFISKPIQTVHLNTILIKHIKDKQSQEVLDAVAMHRTYKTSESGAEKGVSMDEAGDIILLGELRLIFARDTENMIIDIYRSLYAGDRETAHRLAHSLKGLAALIQENELAKEAERVEHSLRDGILPDSALLSSMEKKLNFVLGGISKE